MLKLLNNTVGNVVYWEVQEPVNIIIIIMIINKSTNNRHSIFNN